MAGANIYSLNPPSRMAARMKHMEVAFVHDTSGFRVAVIVAAPDGSHSQILETSLQ